MDRGETGRYEVTTFGVRRFAPSSPYPCLNGRIARKSAKKTRQSAKIAAKRRPRRARPPPPPPSGQERGRPCRAAAGSPGGSLRKPLICSLRTGRTDRLSQTSAGAGAWRPATYRGEVTCSTPLFPPLPSCRFPQGGTIAVTAVVVAAGASRTWSPCRYVQRRTQASDPGT